MDVFLSYSSEDEETASNIYRLLTLQGLECWFAPKNILAGQDYGVQIIDAIEATRVMVLVLSDHSNNSIFVNNEVERAISKGKVVIPFRIQNILPSRSLELFVSRSQWVDAWMPPLEARVVILAEAIHRLLGLPPFEPPQPPPGPVKTGSQPVKAPVRINPIILWIAGALLLILAGLFLAINILPKPASQAQNKPLSTLSSSPTVQFSSRPSATEPGSAAIKPTTSAQATVPAHPTNQVTFTQNPPPVPQVIISTGNAAQVTQLRVNTDVRAVNLAWSADGSRIAAAMGQVTIVDLQTFSVDPAGIKTTGEQVTFSPDGQLFATTSYQEVTLWDVAGGGEIATLADINSAHVSAFSPDSKQIAVGVNNAIKIYDTTTGQLITTIPTQIQVGIRTMVYVPGSSLIAVAAIDEIEFWDPATGQEGKTLKHEGWINSIAISVDGKLLASAAQNQTIKLWDVATGHQLRILSGHTGSVNSVSFSPDGALLASGSDDATVKLWDVAGGKELVTLTGHADAVKSVAFSPDGGLLVSCGMDGSLRLWGVGSTSQSPAPTLLALNPVTAVPVPLSPAALTIANIDQVTQIGTWGKMGGNHVAWTEDGKQLVSYDTAVNLISPASMQTVTTIDYREMIENLAFSPDGVTFAIGAYNGLSLWDVVGGGELYAIPDAGEVKSVAFSPDGMRLAAAIGRAIKVYDLASGQPLYTIIAHQGSVESLAYSPDGSKLASVTVGEIKTWDASTGALLKTMTNENWVYSVAFSPDSTLLATAGLDQTVRLWNVATGMQVHVLTGHTDGVNCVAFSPDGSLLASASDDLTVKIWDIAKGALLKTLAGHSSQVTSVAFSPDGAYLASGSLQDAVRLWGLAP